MKKIANKEDEVRLYKIVASHLQLSTWKTVHTHYIINNRLKREHMDISISALANSISNEFQCPLDNSELRQVIKNNGNMMNIIKLINEGSDVLGYTGGVNVVEEEKQFCMLKVSINKDEVSFFSKDSTGWYHLTENKEEALLLPYSHVKIFMGDNNTLIINKFVNNLHQHFVETIKGYFYEIGENSMTVEIVVFEQSENITSSYNSKQVEAIEMLVNEKDHLQYLKVNVEEDVLKYLRFKGIDV